MSLECIGNAKDFCRYPESPQRLDPDTFQTFDSHCLDVLDFKVRDPTQNTLQNTSKDIPALIFNPSL